MCNAVTRFPHRCTKRILHAVSKENMTMLQISFEKLNGIIWKISILVFSLVWTLSVTFSRCKYRQAFPAMNGTHPDEKSWVCCIYTRMREHAIGRTFLPFTLLFLCHFYWTTHIFRHRAAGALVLHVCDVRSHFESPLIRGGDVSRNYSDSSWYYICHTGLQRKLDFIAAFRCFRRLVSFSCMRCLYGSGTFDYAQKFITSAICH